MLKAVLFDFDGLILDTEGAEYTAWQEVYAAHGCEIPLDVWVPLIGSVGHGFDPCAHLERLTGRALDRATVRAERRRRLVSLIEAMDPLPGVREVLTTAQQLGLKTGIASSSPRSWVLGHLERLGLDVHFDAIRCSDDVRHTKPHPELYRSILDALSVWPDEAIALEDSLNGLRAAQAAGVFCVVVPNSLTRLLPLDAADLLLPALSELRLEEMAAAPALPA